jgi:Tfp pilus assembly protein FimV
MRSIEHAFEETRTRRIAMAAPAHTLSARPATSPPARLTRRGRVVVVLAMLALLVLAGFTLGRVSSQAAGPSKPLPTVTVHAGETLWQIAARVAPHADRRALVMQLEALNHLHDGRVLAGQQLRLPR